MRSRSGVALLNLACPLAALAACTASAPAREPAVVELSTPPAAAPRATAAPTVSPARIDEPLRALPTVATDNGNRVVAADGPRASASSSYPGWPAGNAVDGDLETSWYSARNDSAAHGTTPFLQVELGRPNRVTRVTILGNRDPKYLHGYTIHAGRLELFDATGRRLFATTATGTGNRRDFDFRLPSPVDDVSVVRFSSTSDEGDKNAFGDVAIAEMQID